MKMRLIRQFSHARGAGIHAARRAQTFVRASAQPGKEHAKVIFTIPKEVPWGQEVSLVGSAEGLGNWDTQKSLRLEWHDNNCWSGDVDIPAGDEVEYKFFVQGAGLEDLEWQPGENLLIKIPPGVKGATLLVTDTWQADERVVSWQPAETAELDPKKDFSTSSPDSTLEQSAPAQTSFSDYIGPATSTPAHKAGSAADPTQNGAETQASSSSITIDTGAHSKGGRQSGEDEEAVLEKMTVKELKALCRDYGLPQKKLKAELIEQIRSFQNKAAPATQ